MHRLIFVGLTVVLAGCSGQDDPPPQAYVFTQDIRAYRMMETCHDMFNAVSDDAAHDRLRIHFEAHDYYDWPQATRVVVDDGDLKNDVYVMVKAENGDTGCVPSSNLKPTK